METKLTAAIEEQSKNTSIEHSNTQKFVHGFVKFDFDDVFIPGHGTFHVKGEFPRIQPKYERKPVEDCDVKTLSSKLLVWIKDNFSIAGREEYFKEIVLTAVLFGIYTLSIPDLYGEEMFHAFKFFVWAWYMDDKMEEAIEKKIPLENLKFVTDRFQSIMSGKYDESSTAQFGSVSDFPAFKELSDSLLSLHNSWTNCFPNYEIRSKNFLNDMQLYYGAIVWFGVDEIDERYSEEIFKTYRKIVAGVSATVEFDALVHGVTLTDAIWNSLIFKQFLDALNVIGAFMNDTLGMKKDFKNGEKDNLIVFKVLEKKIPLDVATQQVCDIIASGIIDYDLLKRAVLKEFNYDENLVKFLDIADTFIDGHNKLYQSTRYYSRGSVTLTR